MARPRGREFLDRTLEEWQRYYPQRLSPADADTITTTMTQFFDLLLQWDAEECQGAGQDAGRSEEDARQPRA